MNPDLSVVGSGFASFAKIPIVAVLGHVPSRRLQAWLAEVVRFIWPGFRDA